MLVLCTCHFSVSRTKVTNAEYESDPILSTWISIVEYLGFGFPATTTLLILFIVFGFPGSKTGYEINVHWIDTEHICSDSQKTNCRTSELQMLLNVSS